MKELYFVKFVLVNMLNVNMRFMLRFLKYPERDLSIFQFVSNFSELVGRIKLKA